ncbi:MAG: winged helix DNA-binding domain-containing protein [Candidatus Heimdallarchaeota archaeon]|nr:winged helix DNA-binding domain-containing protein [Candidatus Heimdallarchaeota archaeon]MBY8993818.1 winged helix DNA-binding domain-containing protein [Candidatus Heimdallarchaeota archaeon]
MKNEKIQHYHLQKQSLLTKTSHHDFEDILKKQIGLHSTDYLTPYFSLWARVKNFEPKSLFLAISEDKSAVRMRAFRRTVFVVHRENLESIIGSMRLFLEKSIRDNLKFMVKMGMEDGSFNRIRTDMIELLKLKSPLTTSQIKKELSSKWKGDWVKASLQLLEFEGMVARIGQRYLTDRTIKYGLFEDYFQELKSKAINIEKSLQNIFRLYIQQFGPITIDDFSWWLPLTNTQTKKIIDSMKDDIKEFEFNSKQYFMLKDDYEIFLNCESKSESPVVNFLPYEDHYPKAYKIRNWHISDEVVTKLYDKGTINLGQFQPSIWINGEVKGRWKVAFVDEKKTEMKIEIVFLEKKISQTKELMKLITEQKEELEIFANEKMIPLMKKN